MQNFDWEYTLDIHFHDTNHSFEQFIKKVNDILVKHAPLKYMSRKQKKILAKLGLQKVYLNQLKSKTHCAIHFAGQKIINQNLIFIKNLKNTAILS